MEEERNEVFLVVQTDREANLSRMREIFEAREESEWPPSSSPEDVEKKRKGRTKKWNKQKRKPTVEALSTPIVPGVHMSNK
mgnify:CR=1 FL=1